MDINDRIKLLYDQGTMIALDNLREMEALSEEQDIFYPYLNEFISMLKNEKYIIRVRGFRLLCKQAKWDKQNIIDAAIEDILLAVHEEKPTAVRQVLQYLRYIIPYKKGLTSKIKQTVFSIDCLKFEDTMRPLIVADIAALIQLINR